MNRVDPLPASASPTSRIGPWRRFFYALSLGALAMLALPPFHWHIVLLPSFAGLVWLSDGCRSLRGSFWIGWGFGLGHFVASLYWIINALLVKGPEVYWLIPFTLLGLPAYLALFPGLAVLLMAYAGRRGWARVLLLATAWTAGEWLRGQLLTGFPWTPIGTVWTNVPPLLQLASVTGIFGLSLLTVAAAAMPVTLFEPQPETGYRRLRPTLLMLGFTLVVGLAGMVHLRQASDETLAGIRLRIVQGNIPQDLKWKKEHRTRFLHRYLEMSLRSGEKPITHLVWPETAIPFFISERADVRTIIGHTIPRNGLLLSGAIRSAIRPDGSREFANSLLAIDQRGDIVASYDKSHLVPFGEYIPFRSWIPMKMIAYNIGMFTAGTGPQTLNLNGLPPVGPLVCYEAIFPGAVVDTQNRPHWLLNVTNDAWYGHSTGPWQHLAIAGTRAVEEGLAVIRAANTGISAVFDAYGRRLTRTELGESAILDVDLPAPQPRRTLYSRFGNLVLLLVMTLTTGLGLALGRR